MATMVSASGPIVNPKDKWMEITIPLRYIRYRQAALSTSFGTGLEAATRRPFGRLKAGLPATAKQIRTPS